MLAGVYSKEANELRLAHCHLPWKHAFDKYSGGVFSAEGEKAFPQIAPRPSDFLHDGMTGSLGIHGACWSKQETSASAPLGIQTMSQARGSLIPMRASRAPASKFSAMSFPCCETNFPLWWLAETQVFLPHRTLHHSACAWVVHFLPICKYGCGFVMSPKSNKTANHVGITPSLTEP